MLAPRHHDDVTGNVKRLRTVLAFRDDFANDSSQEVARRIGLTAAGQGLSGDVGH